MANLHGFTRPAVGHMLDHITRHDGDPEQSKYTYKNQRIHPERTHENYALFDRDDRTGFIDSRIAQADTKPRKTTNVMSDWVITLPRNERLRGHEREFFEQAYRHLVEQVGEENVVCAYVHMDETQPHMHFAFVPMVETEVTTNDKTRPLRDRKGNVKRDRKGTVRYERVPVIGPDGKPVTKKTVSQAKLYDRKALARFHDDLEKDLSDHFGFEVGITLDDEGEKALSKLGQRQYVEAKRAIAEAEETARASKSEVAELRDERDELRRKADEEAERLEQLQRARERAERRVAVMEAIASECSAADDAPIGAKGGLLDRISGACARIVKEISELIPEVAASIRKLIQSQSASAGRSGGVSITVRGNGADAGISEVNSMRHGQATVRTRGAQVQKQPQRERQAGI